MKIGILGIRYAALSGVAAGLLLAAPYAIAQGTQKTTEKAKQPGNPAAGAQERPMPKPREASRAGSQVAAKQMPYLGVGVEPLHEAFWAHLRDVLEHNQGVLVADVVPDSPAEKAGIKQYDILLAFGEHKIHSPHELTQLVREDKVGDHVALHILREGKPHDISVSLGERPESIIPRVESLSHRTVGEPAAGDMQWESFDSMTLAKTGEDSFKADISYLNKQGKLEHRTFQGSRQKIHRDIQAQKDIPKEERGQLLRALDLRDEMMFEFPTVYYTPNGRMVWEF
jgi:hypothetical protein